MNPLRQVPRVVFDCSVVLQGAARSRGPAAACLELVEQGQVTLCLSTEVLAELQDVLNRPKLRRKFPALTRERVAELLQALVTRCVFLNEVPAEFKLPRDPKDEAYLNLAIAAGARFIVSRDQDLLDLMSTLRPDAQEFHSRYPGITILDPVAFLQHLSP